MKKMTMVSMLIAIGLGTLSGCSSTTLSSSDNLVTGNEQKQLSFDQAVDNFIEELWADSPFWALYVGYHKYADKLPAPDAANRQQSLEFVKRQRQQFARFDINRLNANQQTDYHLIQNRLDYIEWSINELKQYQWDPSIYNVAQGFSLILNGDFDSLENRLKIVAKRAKQVPAYYQAAINNLTTPTMEHLELAILQNKGGLNVFGAKLMKKIENSDLPHSEKSQLKRDLPIVRASIKGYIDYLNARKADLKAKGNARSFRIGPTLYNRMFDLKNQSQYSASEIYQKALKDKARVLAKMVETTNKLWPKYFPDTVRPADNNAAIKQLIDKISVKHVARENFVEEIRAQIPALEAFIKEKDLITLDPGKPLVVRETPLYQRGFAGASIKAPGPYEKNGKTYYNVTPLDGMTKAQAESYLREYNHWLLQILNIHEAIPGHYTQLVYSNESPSIVKAVLGTSAMREGWAVYTERMMLEEGYGDFEPELWLMYYKWNLRVIANTILDYGIHNLDWSKEQVLDLLMNQVFQEKAEAEGKWRRATLSQVQLTSYYSGYREIYDLREFLKQKQGENFDLKTFHETFLSFGSAPVKYIRQLMLK